jgi:hypothetical protein
MRLAATEGGLQLDDRLAAFAVESLRHLCEQSEVLTLSGTTHSLIWSVE